MAVQFSHAGSIGFKIVSGVHHCGQWYRQFAIGLVALVGVVGGVVSGAVEAKAESPAKYMQRVANELVSAQRSGSASAFKQVLSAHADKPSIGLYSLGNYMRRLPSSERGSYYSGMLSWIARYAAQEAPKYPVMRAVVVGQTKETRNGVYVDSVVSLKSGTQYDVRWWLIRRGKTFKVGDAVVLGISARDQLRVMFTNYISEKGGNPRQLVAKLNEY